MKNSKENKKNRRIIIILIIIILYISCIAMCTVYVNDFYHADMGMIDTFIPDTKIETKIIKNGIVVEPENITCGFIFYPGGKVEHKAYIPLMESLASKGIMCVLVEMPFHLAVLDIDAADGIKEQFPEIDKWYIGGHSLGGSMAASYLEKNYNEFDGLVLLGAYSTTNLSDSDLKVLSIYGSEDKIMNYENYEKNKTNLPSGFTEYIIYGGCHAYFGMYGKQEGDGEASISNREQINQTANMISEFINGI